jgi:hypothetical protein
MLARAAAGEQIACAPSYMRHASYFKTYNPNGTELTSAIYGDDCIALTWVNYVGSSNQWDENQAGWVSDFSRGAIGSGDGNYRNALGNSGMWDTNTTLADWWAIVSARYMPASQKFTLSSGKKAGSHTDGGGGVNAAYLTLNALFNPGVEEPTPTEEITGKLVITQVTGGGDDYDFNDNPTASASGDYAKWFYFNGKTESEYQEESPAEKKGDEYNGVTQKYKHKLEVSIIGVQEVKKTTYSVSTSTDADGNTVSTVTETVTYEYHVVSYATYTRTFNYKTSLPANAQVYFKPVNLNRSNGSTGYALEGDGGIPGYFTTASDKIDMTVDNQSGVSDGNYLETLDINSDKTFTAVFNNNQFGLTRFNFLNQPRDLANTTYEEQALGGAYANGLIGEEPPEGEYAGFWHYNTKLNMSISNGNGGSNDVASLVENNGKETTASNSITYANGGYTGGTWSARFAYSGKYTTDNSFSTSQEWLKKWWAVSYDQKRFYEYGIRYKGTISATEGISESELVDNLETKEKTVKGDGKSGVEEYKGDGVTSRGIWVGFVKNTYYQPIMYGRWEVKTVAGDVN